MGREQNSWYVNGAKSIVLVICIYWGYTTMFQDQPWTFLDAATLVFHEAGHLILFWLGDFMSFLGGTLMQLFVPGLIFGYFLLKRAYFSAAFGLFWLGSSLVNISVYIKDARSMTLDLIGGKHDWHYLLQRMNMLDQDQILGGFVDGLGTALVLSGLVWMATDIFMNTIKLLSKPDAY